MVIREDMISDASLLDPYPGTQIYKSAVKRGVIKNEWEYLKDIYLFPAVPWLDHSKYLDVSAIPDDRFWGVIFKEVRRFYTFLFYRFQALDVKYKLLWLLGRVKVTGLCSECGSSTEVFSEFNLLAQMTYCSNCFVPVYFNYYKIKDFASHYEMLCRELKKAERLVIAGTQLQAMNILLVDHFGLNYERIVGFLEINPLKILRSPFANKPRLRMEDLLNIQPDTILIAGDPIGDAELLLKMFYNKKGAKIPQILHLLPDEKRWSLKLTRLYDRLNGRVGFGTISNSAIGPLSVQLLKLKLVPPEATNLIKHLIKRSLGEKFLQKVKRLYLRCLK